MEDKIYLVRFLRENENGKTVDRYLVLPSDEKQREEVLFQFVHDPKISGVAISELICSDLDWFAIEFHMVKL